MKIAVASDDSTNIARHFGRTRGFLIYETDNGKIVNRSYVSNTFTHHHASGANDHQHDHHHSHEGILSALESCGVVISRGMGHRLLADFETHHKQVFITDISNADEAVQNFLSGNLSHNPEMSCTH
ncbi:MAG: hypothetical protein KDC05_00860 [Bacteroidales bacterium]|nr:hypothetical protein [Bacteroidales bacterium]